MRYTFLMLLVTAACYSPRLGSPGFYCHEDDEPACPDGQVCVSGRCQNRGTRLDGSVSRDMGPTDMILPRDMTLTGPTGCHGLVQCKVGCADDEVCNARCEGNATTAGMEAYQMALSCGQAWCVYDAFPAECDLNAAQTQLIDAFGRPVGSCLACLQNSLAQLFGDTCGSPSSPNCNPSSCRSLYTACLNNTP